MLAKRTLIENRVHDVCIEQNRTEYFFIIEYACVR